MTNVSTQYMQFHKNAKYAAVSSISWDKLPQCHYCASFKLQNFKLHTNGFHLCGNVTVSGAVQKYTHRNKLHKEYCNILEFLEMIKSNEFTSELAPQCHGCGCLLWNQNVECKVCPSLVHYEDFQCDTELRDSNVDCKRGQPCST
jgi:hypothetical protein